MNATTTTRHYTYRRHSTQPTWIVQVTTVEGHEIGTDTIATFATRDQARAYAKQRNNTA